MDDKKPPQEGGDAPMQQSYPSPMIDSAEAQYYEQLTQHRELEPNVGHQPAQPEHHGLPSIVQHQEPQDEHHELHRLQELQEPSTAQQQNARTPVNTAEELQLTAQLTQELAPMMAAGVEDQTQRQQTMPQQEPQAQQPGEAEPDLQQQLQASLQDHEREMQGHEHDLQTHHHHPHHQQQLQQHQHQHQHQHDLQSHGLQDMLPHSGQPQPDPYPPAPPHPNLPHHMAMGHHLPTAHQPQYQLPGATPPRKRTKVSRACDECRRKKIKCDAQSEASEEPCSNCRRSNTQCLFSRVPQKRGPSKGYIKELADRINSIEGKLNTSVGGLEGRVSSDAFASPSAPGDDSRKRPFSSISGDSFQTPSPSRIPSISTEHRPVMPHMQPDFSGSDSGMANGLAPRPLAPIQISGGTDNVSSQGQAEMTDRISHNERPQASVQPADQMPDVDIEDAMFNKYLEVIHPIFPVLASTKARVQSLLWQAPADLQTAFYTSFSSMIRPFLPQSSNQTNGDPVTACRQLNDWEADPKPGSAVIDLLRLQTLVMALIAVDCHGLSSIKGEVGGPSKAEMLGRAVGLGYSMRLYARVVEPDPSPALDRDSDDNVALRTWYVLVMLDRWNAVGMAAPVMISNDSVEILVGLKHIVGDVVFTLLRISYILGHLAPLIFRAPSDPFSPASSLPGLTTEMLRWLFPADVTDPVVHLAYWHVQLLTKLASPLRRPENILHASKNMVALLARNHERVTPLTHHFVTLVCLGLLDLAGADHDETREQAAKLMKDVIEFRLMPSPWNDDVRKKLYQHLPGQPTARTHENLRQLANHAPAVEGGGETAAPAMAAAEDDAQPKSEPPVGITSAAMSLAGAGMATQPGENRNGHGDSGEISRPPVADVQAMLRAGYLTCFEEPAAYAPAYLAS